MTTRKFSRTMMTGLLTVGLMALGGCAMVAYLATTFAPKPKTKPLYELPTATRVLVFPDDMVHRLQYGPLKRIVWAKLDKQLVSRGAVPETVQYDRIQDLQHRVNDFDQLPIDQVAQRLEADYAIYVDIREFQLKEPNTGPLWQGRLHAMVKVVDSTGKRLWPNDSRDGHEVKVEIPMQTSDSETYGVTLTDDLAEELAAKIADLFTTHSAS